MEKNYCIDDYVGKPLEGKEDLHKTFDFDDPECLKMLDHYLSSVCEAFSDFNYGFVSTDKGSTYQPKTIGEVLCRNLFSVISYQMDNLLSVIQNCYQFANYRANVSKSDKSTEAGSAE